MHAGKSILKSFQERRPLPIARTMHFPHNPVTIHIWGAHGKEDSQEQAEWTIWDQQHTLTYPLSQVSTTLFGEKLWGSKLHRKTEASRKHQSYGATQVTFTCTKCPRGHEIWHTSARRNNLKKKRENRAPHPSKAPENCCFPQYAVRKHWLHYTDQETTLPTELGRKLQSFFEK